MDELTAEDMAKMIANALRGQNVQSGHMVSGGRHAAVYLRLPNGQVFQMKLEEIDD